jgi:hypothetical protein
MGVIPHQGGADRMPLRIAPEDRKLAVGFAAVLAFALLLAAFVVQADRGSGGLPSSYSAGNDGTKAAFLLLGQMGYSPSRWTENPRKLADVTANATLILAEPAPAEERDIAAVREFLRRGGRVVATGMSFARFVPEQRIRPGMPHFQWKAYRPQEPSDLTRGIDAIKLAPKFYFDWQKAEAPFREGEESPVTRFPYGAGEVIWWSTSEPMSNLGIREKDNAQLLLNSVGDAGRGPVLWDEYFHQGGRTVVGAVMAGPLRWGILQAALIGAIVCLTYSRRFGPVRASVAGPRLAPWSTWKRWLRCTRRQERRRLQWRSYGNTSAKRSSAGTPLEQMRTPANWPRRSLTIRREKIWPGPYSSSAGSKAP